MAKLQVRYPNNTLFAKYAQLSCFVPSFIVAVMWFDKNIRYNGAI